MRKCLVAHRPLAYPDGTFCCVHDTWPIHKIPPTPAPGCELLWSMGHATLGSGEGDLRAQAQLRFSGSHGHAHRDPLNLTLWAAGRELVSDLGYTHTIYRSYAGSSAAHSLVIVDEQDASAGGSDDDFAATFAYAETGPALTVYLLGVPGSEYFLGTAPSIKRSNRNSDTVDHVRQPIIVARRAGEAPLTSRFAALDANSTVV